MLGFLGPSWGHCVGSLAGFSLGGLRGVVSTYLNAAQRKPIIGLAVPVLRQERVQPSQQANRT
jgi:hypothetical protein